MANGGWYGPKEEWDRLEEPLVELDPVIASFVASGEMRISKNQKESPERSIWWGLSPRCLIQIFLADQAALTWNVWVCCSQDRSGSRFWKTAFLVKSRPAAEFSDRVPELLIEGRELLLQWSAHPEMLEFATNIVQPH